MSDQATGTPGGGTNGAPNAADASQANKAAPTFSYPTTGDAGLDRAYAFVGAQGFGPDSEEMKAAENGNFDLLAASLAVKNPAGWKEHLDLARNAVKADTEAAQATAKATETLVNKVMGDAGVKWSDVQAFVRKQATPAERAELNEAFEAGGAAAKAAAQYVLQAYLKSPGARKEAANASDGSGKGGSNKVGLTSREYQDGLKALRAKYPARDVNTLPEKQVLDNQRLAGRRAGI